MIQLISSIEKTPFNQKIWIKSKYHSI